MPVAVRTQASDTAAAGMLSLIRLQRPRPVGSGHVRLWLGWAGAVLWSVLILRPPWRQPVNAIPDLGRWLRRVWSLPVFSRPAAARPVNMRSVPSPGGPQRLRPEEGLDNRHGPHRQQGSGMGLSQWLDRRTGIVQSVPDQDLRSPMPQARVLLLRAWGQLAAACAGSADVSGLRPAREPEIHSNALLMRATTRSWPS